MHHKIDCHRRLIMYLLMSNMKISKEEAEEFVYELEDSGLIQYDQDGRLKILDLEENS